MLPDVAPEQQAVRVVPAPLALACLRSAPHRSLEQEVPERSQRQGDDHSQPDVVEEESSNRDEDGFILRNVTPLERVV